MRTTSIVILATISLITAACGGTTDVAEPGGSSGAGGSAGTVGSGGSGGASGSGGTAGSSGTGGSSSACPTSTPAPGSACTPPSTTPSPFGDSAHCSWGDDPRPECRTTALCQQDSTWSVTNPDPSRCGVAPLPAACPSHPPSQGTTCDDATLSCWYGDGTRCWCSECAGGSGYPVCNVIDPPQWACAAPAASCPTTMPQAGDPCTVEGASCGPSCELVIECKDGTWHWRKGECPICAAPDTPIATPAGERAIAELRPGDLVYSVEHDAIVAVPILRVGSTRVANHRVTRVTLDDGSVLELSPGHPTADGRTFGELSPGTRLDDRHIVVRSELIPYAHERTYDILPASKSGVYFAAGAMIGSTLESETRGPASSRTVMHAAPGWYR